MKRKILIFISIILGIIVMSGVILYITKDKNSKFPHYKQAFFKVEGSMFVIKETPFMIPLIFVDSNEWSEMASADNIKSLNIFDDKEEKLQIKSWRISNKTKETNYILRSIDVEAIYNKEGIFHPKRIEITYKDNKIKSYDFDDFSIICKDKQYYEKNVAEVSGDINPIITSKNRDEFPYSGLSLFIKGNDKEIEVKKIDLGIKSFGIDDKNLKCYNTEYDLNKIMNRVEEGIKNNEKWAEAFSEIKVVNEVHNNIKAFKIEPTKVENQGTNILIPLTRLADADMSGIKIFNIKINLEISGREKELFNFQPFYVTPITRDKEKLYKFLQEEGK